MSFLSTIAQTGINLTGDLTILGYGLVALGPALAMGMLVGRALEGIARQPEAAGQIRTTMLLGLAFVEAIALFGFVLAILAITG